MVAILLLLLVFSTKTVLRSAEWQSAGSIAQSALSVNPGNAKVFMSVGNELTQQVTGAAKHITLLVIRARYPL